jgi:acyl carrier protein
VSSPDRTTARLTDEQLHELVVSFVADLAPAATNGGLPPITGQLRLVEDLGYYSLALLELAFSLEDELDLPPLDEETGRSIRTVADIEQYLANELKALDRLAD